MARMCQLVFALALIAQTAAVRLERKSSLEVDLEGPNRPVSKVINLLKDMKAQLEAEGKEDEEIYEKISCWCETNDKEKSKAIADANQKISDLTSEIESLTAASARLQEEIKTTEVETEKNQDSLGKATAMRMKEMGEFQGEEKDLLASISALKAAIITLSKHHELLQTGVSLLQTGNHMLSEQQQQQLVRAANVAQHELRKHAALLEGVLTRTQKHKVLSFIQQAPSAGSYAPASGEILGILKQMKETFESNLKNGQKEELEGSESYENNKAAKEEEIAAGIDQVDTKTEELATTDEKLANAKEDLEDTQASLEADEKFLENLRAKCEMLDQEFEMRSKTRAQELEAVAKANEILSGDEAHDLFAKTFNFVQRQQRENRVSYSKRRAAASKLLAEVASKNHNPKLVALAYQIRLDAFTKVKKTIDDMIAELLKQKADEIKHKDFCVGAFNENNRITEKKNREKKDAEETIEDLTMVIDELTKAIETLKAEIAEMKIQKKRAGEDREIENKDFQTIVADNRATQKLLTQALEVLKGFYEKKAAFMQKSSKHKQEPPVSFKPYKKNASSGGVMGMIQQIIDDAKAEEAEAIVSESDAQKAYEAFVKDTNAAVEEKTKAIVVKTEAKAKAEDEKTKTEEVLSGVMTDLEGLAAEAADLHGECDFILKNFEIRQSARDGEIEALKMVKAILSGAKFGAFLQSNAFADSSSTMGDSSDADAVDPLQGYLDSA